MAKAWPNIARRDGHLSRKNHIDASITIIISELDITVLFITSHISITLYIFIMYARLFIFSIVSASIINSNPTLSLEDSFSEDALPFDQITLDSNLLGPPLDSTSPLFDAENPSTDDTFNKLDLFDSSSLFRDNTLQIADCSTPDIPHALDKSRVKRSDDAASCSNSANPDDSNIPTLMLPQNFDPEKQSDTCWQLTLGLLPFAVVYSGDGSDRIRDTTRKYTVTSTNHRFSPVTLRRATLST